MADLPFVNHTVASPCGAASTNAPRCSWVCAAALMMVTLSACAADRSLAHGEADVCRRQAVGSLVGKVAPDDAAILRRVSGTIVRRIAPGDPTTRDLRRERVTVTIDPATRVVVAASCG